jgi:hypothetical protein
LTAQVPDRDREAGDVAEDREGRAQRLHQHPGQARAQQARGGFGGAELRLRVDQAVAPDQKGHEDLLGGAAHHETGAQHEFDRIQPVDGEPALPPGDRHARQAQRHHRVAAQHDGQAPAAVEQDAGGQPEQQEGQGADRGQGAHLAGRGVQQQGRADGQGQQRDLGAEVGQDAAEPETAKVGVAQLRIAAELAEEGN